MAVVQVNENTLDFILNNKTDNFSPFNEISLLKCKKIYYIDMNDNYILLDEGEFSLKFVVNDQLALDPKQNVVQFNIGVISSNTGSTSGHSFIKLEVDAKFLILPIVAKVWQSLDDEIGLIKGFRVEDYTFEEGQTLETLNEILNPYITNMTVQIYSITVNGKQLNLINGKAVKRIINGFITYEVVEKPTDEIPDYTTISFKENAGQYQAMRINFNKLDTQPTDVYKDGVFVATYTNQGLCSISDSQVALSGTYTMEFRGEGKIEIGDENVIETLPQNSSSTPVWKVGGGITAITFGKNYGNCIGTGFCSISSQSFVFFIPSFITQIKPTAILSGNYYGGFRVQTTNLIYDSRDNCNAIIETATNTLLVGCTNTAIVEGIEKIGKSSLNGCAKTELVLSSTVKEIGMASLSMTTLTNIVLNEGLQTIKERAFENCTALNNVIIPKSVIQIDKQAFSSNTTQYLTALTTMTFNQSETDVITFGTNVFKKKKATNMTIYHYGCPSVLDYNWSGDNITPTFVDLREQQ